MAVSVMAGQKIPARHVLYLFAGAHGLHDLFTGIWVVVLAAQRSNLELSYTEIGMVQAFHTLLTGLMQPVFGSYFDRSGKPYLALWSVAGTTLMITIGALAPNYVVLMLAGLGAGMSSAAFHSAGLNGAKLLAAGRKSGRSTAIFLLGGNAAYAIGAAFGGWIIDKHGLSMLTLPALFILFSAPLMVRLLHGYLRPNGDPEGARRSTREILLGGRAAWLPVLAYIALIFAYQFYQTGYTTFLPQYYQAQGRGLSYAGWFTAIYLFFAAVGSFVGGSLSDRLPRLWLAFGAMACIAPLGFLLLRAEGLPLWALSIALGLLTNMPLPILLLIGQEIMPGGANGAAGFTFGLTFVARALLTPIVGLLADEISLLSTLTLVGTVPLCAAFLLLFLPKRSN